jgi:hypothetical protein
MRLRDRILDTLMRNMLVVGVPLVFYVVYRTFILPWLVSKGMPVFYVMR